MTEDEYKTLMNKMVKPAIAQAKVIHKNLGRRKDAIRDTFAVQTNNVESKLDPMMFIANGLPQPEFEYKFHPTRKWRFDVAFPEQKVFIEIQGGIWNNGRHVRGAALIKEWEKLNTASSMGWRGLFCQPSDIHKDEFMSLVKEAVDRR